MAVAPNKNAKVTSSGVEVVDWPKVLRDNEARIQRIRELPTQPSQPEDDKPAR